MALSGAEIETKLSLVIDENEALERENALFQVYMERASRRVTAPAHEEEEAEAAATPKAKKKDAPKKEGPREVTLEQKTEIAQQEVEDLKEEIEMTKERSEKLLDRLLAISEECDMRTAQVKKDIYEFRRECVIGGENPRTGKIVAEKIIRYFEEKLRQKDSMVDKLKLKNQALKIQIQKLDKQLGEKEEMGEVLHAIDFDQLRIENQQYMEKIKERTKESVKLKQTAGKTVQVLNSLKGKLTALTSQSAALELQTAEKEQQLASIKDEIRRVQEEKTSAERINRASRKKQTEVKMPQVMDYVHRRVDEDEARRQVESWERKLEIARRGAGQARKQLAMQQQQEQQPQPVM